MKCMMAGAALAAVLGVSAHTDASMMVEVVIRGEVEFNQINSGQLGLMNPGDPVEMSFLLDPGNFVDGAFTPTRGYVIDESSFSFTAGAANLGLQNPYVGTPYFVLRNDDPAVDGFFLGSNPDGFPDGVALDQNGIFEQFRSRFEVSYDNDPLPSLDILDAVGAYDFTGLTVFGMGILDGPFDAAGFIYQDMTITKIPAPATLAMLAPCVMLGRRRRR